MVGAVWSYPPNGLQQQVTAATLKFDLQRIKGGLAVALHQAHPRWGQMKKLRFSCVCWLWQVSLGKIVLTSGLGNPSLAHTLAIHPWLIVTEGNSSLAWCTCSNLSFCTGMLLAWYKLMTWYPDAEDNYVSVFVWKWKHETLVMCASNNV